MTKTATTATLAPAPKLVTECRARYYATTDQIEFDWLNADAPGRKPHGNEFIPRHEIGGQLNALSNRCYEAPRHGAKGQWVDLTRTEMVAYGVKQR